MRPDEFWSNMKLHGECWEWQGPINGAGYGTASVEGIKEKTAHRIAYILTYGPISSPKLFVCHTCDNRCCARPDHLFLGTALENSQDRTAKGRSLGPKKRIWFPRPRKWYFISADSRLAWIYTGYGHMHVAVAGNNRTLCNTRIHKDDWSGEIDKHKTHETHFCRTCRRRLMASYSQYVTTEEGTAS
jgi:hypothetical protein